MESIRNAENEDLKRTAHVEFVENKEFDKKAKNVINAMIQKLKEKLGDSDLEKCSAVWKEFVNIKQKENESVKDFVARFEQTKMKNMNIRIPGKVLAIHLMMKTNIETQSKENVLTKTNVTDDDQIYTSMMKYMKEMKSNITAEDEEKNSPSACWKDKEENKACYEERNRYGSFSRGRSRDRLERRSNFSRSRERYRGYRNSSRDWRSNSSQ